VCVTSALQHASLQPLIAQVHALTYMAGPCFCCSIVHRLRFGHSLHMFLVALTRLVLFHTQGVCCQLVVLCM
jgi:hypothetical protein